MFALTVEVPPNARATVRLPRAAGTRVHESGESLAKASGIVSHRSDGDSELVEIGSGKYHFTYPWRAE